MAVLSGTTKRTGLLDQFSAAYNLLLDEYPFPTPILPERNETTRKLRYRIILHTASNYFSNTLFDEADSFPSIDTRWRYFFGMLNTRLQTTATTMVNYCQAALPDEALKTQCLDATREIKALADGILALPISQRNQQFCIEFHELENVPHQGGHLATAFFDRAVPRFLEKRRRSHFLQEFGTADTSDFLEKQNWLLTTQSYQP